LGEAQKGGRVKSRSQVIKQKETIKTCMNLLQLLYIILIKVKIKLKVIYEIQGMYLNENK
jgi:hypothetical protein